MTDRTVDEKATLKAQPFSKQTGNGNRNLVVLKKEPILVSKLK